MLKPPRVPGGRSVALLAVVALIAGSILAQVVRGRASGQPPGSTPAAIYTPQLLSELRRAAAMVPGDLPIRIGVQRLLTFDMFQALAADGAPDDTVLGVRAAYQIRYPDGWIMVDAGILHDGESDEVRAAYERLQRALAEARMIVFTHEHQDHVGGVVRSEHRAALEANTLFTTTQLDWLRHQMPGSLIPLTDDEAARFASFDYDPLVAIAPGVVLVKAPGHTDGSQMVYVKLVSGTEIILAGDVSYLALALREDRQKPDNPDLDEDRDAIAHEMAWLRSAEAAGVTVVLSHDGAQLDELVSRGVLMEGIDIEAGAAVGG